MGYPGGSDGKVSACNVGDQGSIPGLGRSPGEENGNPLQYSCLENSMDGGAWWVTFCTWGGEDLCRAGVGAWWGSLGSGSHALLGGQ